MATFTSTLPDQLLRQLAEKANELKMPKNKLIEKGVQIYLTQLEKAAYIKSYKRMAEDTDILSIAEEGMADYVAQLKSD